MRRLLIFAALVSACAAPPAQITPVSPTAHDLGDDAHLDQLWAVCASGSADACDELERLSPPLSEYRTFAIEQGARND